MSTLWPVYRGCCYRSVAPSSQNLWLWSGAHFEHQAYSFSYFVVFLSKVKLMKIWRSSDKRNFQVLLRTVKFSSFVFNKVVRWHEWGEVENVNIVHNFSHFVIFLRKIMKIDGNLTKFWHTRLHFSQFFLRHGVYSTAF